MVAYRNTDEAILNIHFRSKKIKRLLQERCRLEDLSMNQFVNKLILRELRKPFKYDNEFIDLNENDTL